jgi:hypothetical protein
VPILRRGSRLPPLPVQVVYNGQETLVSHRRTGPCDTSQRNESVFTPLSSELLLKPLRHVPLEHDEHHDRLISVRRNHFTRPSARAGAWRGTP